MTPDLGYYIGCFDFATFAHTLPGSFLVALPSAVGLLIAFYIFCKPVAYALPRPHRAALRPICPAFRDLWPARWPLVLASLLLGIWTHNFWDAFTHDKGWFVQRIPWLRETVVHLGKATFGMPFVLQILSTFIGFAIVAAAYCSWLRGQKTTAPNDYESDGWRYLTGLAIGAGALFVALPAAIHFASGKQGVLFARAVMFRVAIYVPAIALPLGLFVASVIYLRRRPA